MFSYANTGDRESNNNPPGEADILQKNLTSNKKIRIPKYGELILLAEFGILYFGIRNTAQGIQESGIPLTIGI